MAWFSRACLIALPPPRFWPKRVFFHLLDQVRESVANYTGNGASTGAGNEERLRGNEEDRQHRERASSAERSAPEPADTAAAALVEPEAEGKASANSVDAATELESMENRNQRSVITTKRRPEAARTLSASS